MEFSNSKGRRDLHKFLDSLSGCSWFSSAAEEFIERPSGTAGRREDQTWKMGRKQVPSSRKDNCLFTGTAWEAATRGHTASVCAVGHKAVGCGDGAWGTLKFRPQVPCLPRGAPFPSSHWGAG